MISISQPTLLMDVVSNLSKVKDIYCMSCTSYSSVKALNNFMHLNMLLEEVSLHEEDKYHEDKTHTYLIVRIQRHMQLMSLLCGGHILLCLASRHLTVVRQAGHLF